MFHEVDVMKITIVFVLCISHPVLPSTKGQKEVFKNFLGFDNISINDYVTTDLTSTTCNHGFKIISKIF